MSAQPPSDAVATTFDEASAAYAREVNDAMAFSGLSVDRFAAAKAERLKQLARAAFGDPAQIAVLDLGCGIGTFHRYLDHTFGALHGLDVSPASIELARAANPHCTYAVYDGVHAPYEDGAFDLIFVACVIHHVPVPDWPGFAAQMRRLLKPGGLAVVFEHNPFNPLTRLVVSRCAFDADAVLLSPRTLRGLMAEAGFTDIRSRSIFTLPPLSALCTRLDPLFARLPFGAQYEMTARAAR
ncbi:class I SAM-dependent methyltransferase [Ancylobacter pratisalsi]|uniref:Methyltransferase domain-containing protein n=1 Tax=Ancylobacter pratisalsi TaxID=1745854 RepID=A0A6P1YHS3_9HYPH|nr:class I SAM-dependent methyltransferase [Ancylobacter pratisalsi]QIB32702.1 methyltransferase domain-containing protein [Ancylobacter pratisalsi]